MDGRELTLGVVDGRGPGEKLELVCRDATPGTVEAELRLLAWGEGVGWYAQRTLPLPADLAALRALLRRAEALTRRRAPAGSPARVVTFPGRERPTLVRPA